MKKIIKIVDKERGIIQQTFCDERWYIKSSEDGKHIFVPSTTWICESYPKGIGFYKWLANHSWDEAEALKQSAGEKGSKVHQAIEDLLDGKEIKMNSQYANPTTEQLEELAVEEYEAIMSFVKFFGEVNPITIAKEMVVFNDEIGYAGTVDWICKIGADYWLIDFKTSQNIWASHELQVSAYKHALSPDFDIPIKLAILQVGYWRNKNKYKFTEIQDKFNLFLSCMEIWKNEHSGEKPLQRDYPESLCLSELAKNAEEKKQKST